MMTYQTSGVALSLGDEASRILYQAARKTWKNRHDQLGEVLVPFDDFSGLRAIDVSQLPKGTWMNMGFDGVGTKIEVAERMQTHHTIAHDLFAMVCDDAVVRGAEPVLIGSILDFNTLGQQQEDLDCIRQLAAGYVAAAELAGVAVVNGEIAELGNRVGGFGQVCYNWGAAVVWFANKDRLLTGHSIQEGDALIGVREDGFRSNGLSLVRKSFASTHGDQWHDILWRGRPLGQWVLQPSRIYSRAVVAMTGGLSKEPRAILHGAAHITGGGLPEKLGRTLKPSGLGALIDTPFAPPDVMLECQKLATISDKEAYSTWHMGQGMVLLSPEPEQVATIASEFNLTTQIIGRVVADPTIKIRSKGIQAPDKFITFRI